MGFTCVGIYGVLSYTHSLTGEFGFFKIDPLLRITSPGIITYSEYSGPDSMITDGEESDDPSSSEGFPIYVTGGGESDEMTVTSTSEELFSGSGVSS